jgi:tetratricopeptide (TPR) repeat protein
MGADPKLFAGLVAGGMVLFNLMVTLAQANAVKRILGVTMPTRFPALVLYARRAFLWVVPCALVLASGVAPVWKLTAVIVTELVYVAYATFLFDLVRMARVRRLLMAKNNDRALAAAKRAARAFALHSDGASSARLTASMTRLLCAAGEMGVAESLLAPYEDVALPRAHQWLVWIELAAYRTQLGRIDAARHTLGRCTGVPPADAYGSELAYVQARLDAADGNAPKALQAADGQPGGRWETVRAHAYAALDRYAEAREALEHLRTEGGDATIRQIAAGQGPAALLARQLVEEKSSPYRS